MRKPAKRPKIGTETPMDTGYKDSTPEDQGHTLSEYAAAFQRLYARVPERADPRHGPVMRESRRLAERVVAIANRAARINQAIEPTPESHQGKNLGSPESLKALLAVGHQAADFVEAHLGDIERKLGL